MMATQIRKPRLAVLISGGGTTLKNLLHWSAEGRLAGDIQCVISSNPHARGLEYAAASGVPAATIEWPGSPAAARFSQAVFAVLDEHQIDWVVMGGFLKKLLIPEAYRNRVINIHPSLIPSFCGHGFYGARVHQGVLEYGAKVTGCTVHFVDNEYDHGPVIAQRAVDVADQETPESLAQRVFAVECQLYPETINRLCTSTVVVLGRQVQFQ